jgi:hypothetical protein
LKSTTTGIYPPGLGLDPEDLDKAAEEREQMAALPEKTRRENEAKGIFVTDGEMIEVAQKMGLPIPAKGKNQ